MFLSIGRAIYNPPPLELQNKTTDARLGIHLDAVLLLRFFCSLEVVAITQW